MFHNVNRYALIFLALLVQAVLGCNRTDDKQKASPPGAQKGPSMGTLPDKDETSERPFMSENGSIQWSKAMWVQDAKEPVLQLTFAKDSDWKACNCAKGEHLGLLVVYIQDGKKGSAVKLSAQTVTSQGGTSLQSVLKPEGGLDFIFLGGNIATNDEKIEGAVIRVSHSDQLKPEVLVKSQSIGLRLSPGLYAPTARFEGKGRIAFVLQSISKDDKQAIQLSNVIEVPVEFVAVKKRDD